LFLLFELVLQKLAFWAVLLWDKNRFWRRISDLDLPISRQRW